MTIAFLDANVFPHVRLTDVLLTFADFNLFSPIFSEEVLQEATRTFIDKLGKTPDFVMRYIEQIRTIDSAYLSSPQPPLCTAAVIPDVDDRHVVAAAYNGNAEFIITFNLKDFPNEQLETMGLTALHPDDFLTWLASQQHKLCMEAMNYLVDSKKNPPRTMQEELNHLAQTGMPMFASAIRNQNM